jgi:hypothetical protein
VQASGNVTIGGPDADDLNWIGGNTGSGIALTGTATGNVIQNNRIGLNFHSTAVPNTSHGISGGTPGLLITGNVISGNTMHGVRLNGVADVTLTANLIGLNIAGSAALPNGQDGVNISGNSTDIHVGTGSTLERNTISGNTQSGIEVNGVPAAPQAAGASQQGNIRIGNNRIGTNLAGTAKVGNGADGITVNGSTEVGIVNNLISGNNANGVQILGSTDVSVLDNEIGTDAAVTGRLGNLQAGVLISGTSSNNLIGSPPEHNIIAANSVGVQIDGLAQENDVFANHIGVNIAGTGANNLGNTVGVRLLGFDNNIGQDFTTRNVISGNSTGVEIKGITAIGNTLHRNIIGLSADESTVVANKSAIDILDGARDNNLRLNTVAGNSSSAIRIFDDNSTGNTLRQNLVYDNAGPGIDLGADGVTANDAGDSDSGPNGLQNFPVISEAWNDLHGGDDVAVLELDSKPNTSYELTLYGNIACDSSGHGEGRLSLEVVDVITDANGHAEVRIDMDSASWETGNVATAVARDLSNGDTSEFSACTTVLASPPGTPTPTPVGETPSPTHSPTPVVTATPTGAATPTPTGTSTAAPSGTATATSTPATGTTTNTAAPTPTGTTPANPVPGDVNCDGDVDNDDGIALLLFAAGLSDGAQEPPCPDLGETAAGAEYAAGDLNCDGVVDAVDALYLFAHLAGAPLTAVGAGCLPVG